MDENAKVFQNVYQALKPGGYFLIDFMNTQKVIKGLVAEEVKKVGDVEFHIKREVKEGNIFKYIDFEDKGKSYSYYEKVQALQESDFKSLLSEAGFSLIHQWGDYNGTDFEGNSKRMVLLAQKQ